MLNVDCCSLYFSELSISKCIIGIVSFNDDKLVTTVREELGYGKVREGGWGGIRGGKGL